MDHLDWLDRADPLPDVFGPPQISPQGQDGTPHLSYYDVNRSLSFVWDGLLSQHVNVSHGGSGEPVKWTFDFMEFWQHSVPEALRHNRTPQFSYNGDGFWSAAAHFKTACANWTAHMEKEFANAEANQPEGKQEFKICFDECNVNWTNNVMFNQLFLKGVQNHMNHILQTRGHVFLNDVLDCLGAQRVPHGAVSGWLSNEKETTGDGYIDFLPQDMLSRGEPSVWLKFNVDGVIYENI